MVVRSVLGIDLSTQSCTLEVRSVDDFSVVARSRIPLASTHPPVSEHNAEDWWRALAQGVRQLAESTDLSAIVALSVSGQCHGLVPLDVNGFPIRPVKLWNDTSTTPYLERLFDRVSRKEWAERVGSVPTAAFTVSKLAWFIAEEPDNFAKTVQIVLPHDYITYRLTGRYCTDRSEASGTGYFDSVSNSYDYELLAQCFGDLRSWTDLFPEVLGPSEIAGYVTDEAAEILGITSGIPVAVGGGDQHVAALGLGMTEGDVVFSLGTSGVVITMSDRPVSDPSGQVNGVANVTGGWLPLVCTLNATKVSDWAARLLNVSVQELDQLALDANTGEIGPVFATYLDGERSPSLPLSVGVLAGLKGESTREDVALSVFRGVLAGLLRGLDSIEAHGVDIGGRVMAIGGGARSAAYIQFLADLLNRPVSVINEPEATARGACIQALAVYRHQDVSTIAIQFPPTISRTIQPRSGELRWEELKSVYLPVAAFAGTQNRDSFTQPDRLRR
ncbi:xylulokinase [Schaalia sp. ZJ405]|uniref:xylulokinase n=1 Tax=Schaalia sp. ZJ405 TaxID=2709403 RepID=UPI001E656734|nr:xylulokinase [Schaalia sp. ZJ405]